MDITFLDANGANDWPFKFRFISFSIGYGKSNPGASPAFEAG